MILFLLLTLAFIYSSFPSFFEIEAIDLKLYSFLGKYLVL